MDPKLVVLVPFDVGKPLSIPEAKDAHVTLRNALGEPKARGLLGPSGRVHVRSEVIDEHIELNGINENTSFPWGTYAILGPSVRLWTTSGDLIDAWRSDVTLLARSRTGRELNNPVEAAALLNQAGGWQIAVDAFGCGAACLRLQLDLEGSAAAHIVDLVKLLEYAIYGDACQDGSADKPNRNGSRIDSANRCLAGLMEFLADKFGDPNSSHALQRGGRSRRPGGILVRWVSHVLVMGRQESPHISFQKYMDDRRKRIAGAPTLVEVETEYLHYKDDTWISSMFVDDPDIFFRMLYVITVTDIAAFLAIVMSDMIDAELMAAMASPSLDRIKAEKLRDIRLYAQICAGQIATWRISAHDVDKAVVASRAEQASLNEYREQISASAETLYALESARYVERQHRISDAFVAAAAIVSLVSIWTLILALKDTDAFIRDVPPHLKLLPTAAPDILTDFIVVTIVAAFLFIAYVWRSEIRSALPGVKRRLRDRPGR